MDGFISYAHEDRGMFGHLERAFRSVELSGGPKFWHDRVLTGGQTWETMIKAAIARSHYFVLLLSPASIVSDYILTKEWPAMTARAHACKGLIVPVLLRHCMWQHRSEFAAYQVIPIARRGPRAINQYRPHDIGATEMGVQLMAAIQNHRSGGAP